MHGSRIPHPAVPRAGRSIKFRVGFVSKKTHRCVTRLPSAFWPATARRRRRTLRKNMAGDSSYSRLAGRRSVRRIAITYAETEVILHVAFGTSRFGCPLCSVGFPNEPVCLKLFKLAAQGMLVSVYRPSASEGTTPPEPSPTTSIPASQKARCHRYHQPSPQAGKELPKVHGEDVLHSRSPCVSEQLDNPRDQPGDGWNHDLPIHRSPGDLAFMMFRFLAVFNSLCDEIRCFLGVWHRHCPVRCELSRT